MSKKIINNKIVWNDQVSFENLTVKELRSLVKQMGGNVTEKGKYKNKIGLLWEIRLDHSEH